MAESLDLAAVQTALAGTRFAGPFHHAASTSSTNALALAAAQAGARAGVWTADEQTAGRGRGGHRWHSPPGAGLYVSALVSPRLASAHAMQLSFAAGLAARHAIAEVTNLDADLRWPNDLMLRERKCGGILVETSTEPVGTGDVPARLRYAVVGIGINVGHASFPPELERLATSLRRETGDAIAREPLLTSLLRALDRELEMLEREAGVSADAEGAHSPYASLHERLSLHSSWIRGKRVVVDDRYTGTTAGLTEEGFLQVTGDDGTRHIVRSGGVRAWTPPEADGKPKPT